MAAGCGSTSSILPGTAAGLRHRAASGHQARPARPTAFPAAVARPAAAVPRGAGEAMSALRQIRAATLTLVAVLALALPAAAQAFPQLTGRVVDEAGVIDPPVRAAIDAD